MTSMDSGETSDLGAEIERRDSLSKLEEPVAFELVRRNADAGA